MALGQSNRRSKKFVPPKLQITSMMDMFTIILIFLLFSYSDKPDTLSLEKDMELPNSSAKIDYKDDIKLIVSQNKLKLGDEVIANVKNGEVIGLNPEKLQESDLYKKLKALKDKDKEKVEESEGGNKEEAVLFLCDKHLSFKTINTIMKTAGIAGYPNFQFGVLKK